MALSTTNNSIFPAGDPAPSAYFTGSARVKMLVPITSELNTTVANVVFEPGCRNNWHSHKGGQILVCTEGKGYFQEKGKEVQLLEPGDVVEILPDIIHWHGARADGPFTHLAIGPQSNLGAAVWLNPVTDEEYKQLKKD